MVDDTVDSEENLEEKTREVTDITLYHISWNFPQQQRYIMSDNIK